MGLWISSPRTNDLTFAFYEIFRIVVYTKSVDLYNTSVEWFLYDGPCPSLKSIPNVSQFFIVTEVQTISNMKIKSGFLLGTKLTSALFIIVPRLGKPSDISGAVAFLVSDEAAYMTGETMVLGGGYPGRL